MNALPKGIVIPLMTPFDAGGEVDVQALKRLIAFNLESKVHGLFVLGSAGQGPVMSPDQRRQALEVILETVNGRVSVIAHVGTPDSYTGKKLAQHAKSCGADAIAIVPPYYYSDHKPYEVQRHYCEVAEGAPDLPIVVYDNRQYTGIPMTPQVVKSLRDELPAVLGIKLSFLGLEQMLAYVRLLPEMRSYSGSIEYLSAGVPLGIAGVINPPSSFFPELCVDVWNAVVEKRYEDALELQIKINEIRAAVSKYLAKYGRITFHEVMTLRELQVIKYPRWTTAELTVEERNELRKDLIEAGAEAYLTADMQK